MALRGHSKRILRHSMAHELLSKISNLSITTYNYKNTPRSTSALMAEDFVGAFDTGVIRESDGKRDDMYSIVRRRGRRCIGRSAGIDKED